MPLKKHYKKQFPNSRTLSAVRGFSIYQSIIVVHNNLDCKYSTIKNILLALIGGTTDEFACTEQVENELRNLEKLEQQAAKLSHVEAENERLINRFKEIDELHRKDIRAVREEYQEQIAFLKDQLKAWQTRK